MAVSLVVLIAPAELVTALKTETDFRADILVFADTDVGPAFQAITDHHPTIVLLQRDVLATPRAAELIGRIRTDLDPTVSHVQIRVLSNVVAYVQRASGREQGKLDATTAVPGDPLPQEYDDRRWARRCRMRPDVKMRVDSTPARLSDLSLTGAQLVMPALLRPSQRVRIQMSDDQQVLSVAATVIWASLEPSRGADTPTGYRVGVTFIDADPKTLEAFCARNQDDRVLP